MLDSHLGPDLNATRLHLRAITGETDPAVSWQVFADDKTRPHQARSYHGRLADVLPQLRAAQAEGFGVFVAVNETDGNGRRKENITSARAMFLDLDGTPLPDSWPVPPTLIMQSSNGAVARFQCWWSIEPTTDFPAWTAFQKLLAQRYDGDPKCTMLTQVGRAAGFYHQKNPAAPWQVKIIADNTADLVLPWTLSALAEQFGLDLQAEVAAAPDRDRAKIVEPPHGWDTAADVARAREYAAEAANWHKTSDGGVSVYRMACDLRDLAISEDGAAGIIGEFLPVHPAEWPDDHIDQKVANAYKYAVGDVGARSAAAAGDDFDDDIEPEKVRPPKPSRFQRYRLTDLMKLDPPEWLVDKIVPAGGLVQLYGARKRNKTFVGLDLCLCIATGRSFHGVAVKRGRVTYVIGEGGAARFGDRILAWCRHNKVAPAELDDWFDVVPVRVGVDNKNDLRDFMAGDDRPSVLVVFDTLARSMDGDENSTQDMNRAVKGLDMVREHYKGAVLVVHHSGKDEDKKGRGSTVLPGAVDATLKVYKDAVGKTVLSVEEIRDAEAGLELRFQPVSVIVGDDLRSSLAMCHIDDTIVSEPQTGEDRVLFEIVERGGVDSRDELVDKDVKGMSRSNVSNAISMLKGKKLVVVDGSRITATAEGIEMAMLMGAAVPEETTDNGN